MNTLEVPTPYGPVRLYNFEHSKLSSLIPTGETTCTMKYDDTSIEIQASASDVNDVISNPTNLSDLEKLAVVLSDQKLAGSKNYLMAYDIREYGETTEFRQICALTWSTQPCFNDKSITLKISVKLQVSQKFYLIESKVFTWDLSIKVPITRKRIDVEAEVEASIREYFSRYRSGSSRWNRRTVCRFDALSDLGVLVFFEDICDNEATDVHLSSVAKHFDGHWQSNQNTLNRTNEVLIQSMKDKAQILAANIRASAAIHAAKIGAEATCRAANRNSRWIGWV